MNQNADPARPGRSLHTADWSQSALASVYWHTRLEPPAPPPGFEPYPLDRATRLLLQASHVEKLIAASMLLRAERPVGEVRGLIESARPRHGKPLTSPEVEEVRHLLTAKDLRVPAEPNERWAAELARASDAIRGLGLSGGFEHLSWRSASAPAAGAGCHRVSFSFATLRPLADLRHILDPQRWDDCCDLFIQTHVLATPPPPSGTTWGTRLDLYEEVGLAYPGPCDVPFKVSISNLLDADFQATANDVRAEFVLRESYESVLDVDEGFFAATQLTFGALSLRIVTGEKCVHFTCAPLDALAQAYLGILLPFAAFQMISTCVP